MAISFVQHAVNNAFGTSSASLKVTITASGAGNMLVCAGSFDRGGTLSSITDTNGDGITTVIAVTDEGTTWKYFCSAFLTATAGNTDVTVNFSVNPNFCDMFVWEITGLTSWTKDASPNTHGTNTGTSVDSGATGTLNDSNEAAIAYAADAGAITAGGTGWTNFTTNGTTGSGGEEQVLSSNSSINGTFSGTANAAWAALCATFKSGSAATPITAGFFIEDTTLQRQPQSQRMLKPDHQFATPFQPANNNPNASQPQAAGTIKTRMIPC